MAGSTGATDNLSQHRRRLQAAAAAASVYEKSFVYPSPSTLVWYAHIFLKSYKAEPELLSHQQHDMNEL